MINIDDRLLPLVDQNELHLLIHITKRLNKQMFCFPSNKTLMRDTGWGDDKLAKVKKSLVDKQLLRVVPRYRENVQISNIYIVQTDLIGVYVSADKLSRTPENNTPISDFSGDGDGLENEGTKVLTHSEVLFTDSNESDGNNPSSKEKPSDNKSTKKMVDPCYQKFIAIWNDAFPNLLDFPRDGKHFKSLIKKTEQLLVAGNQIVSEESKCDLFTVVVLWAKQNHWAGGQPVGTFDSKFKSIVYEMKNGKKKDNFNSQNSASRLFGKYANL